jgi:FKBP-type peptidyl-prolyl cis-trans isomerase
MKPFLLFVGTIALGACLSLDVPEPEDIPSNPATDSYASSTGVDISKMTKMSNGIYYQDLIEGTGDPLTEKKIVNLTFVARIPNGFVFDRATAQSLVDLRQVLTGFGDGMIGMKPGGTRKTVVPSSLAYGPRGAAGLGVPSNTTIVYDISLISY